MVLDFVNHERKNHACLLTDSFLSLPANKNNVAMVQYWDVDL